MIWVAVVGGVALAGALALGLYMASLRHRAEDLLGEVAMLRQQAGQLGSIIGKLQIPPLGRG